MSTENKSPRRARGDHSVFWVESRQRFKAVATLGYKPNGKRDVVVRWGKSRSAALEALRSAVREHSRGGHGKRSAVRVKDVVAEFLEFGMPGRSQATVDKHKSLAANHILPELGEGKVTDLKAVHVERWLKAMAAKKSSATVVQTHSLLTRALQRAVVHGLVGTNVAAVCSTPTGQVGRPSKSFTLEEVVAILRQTEGHWMYPYVAFSLTTGARTEEARALKWTWTHLADGDDDVSHVRLVDSVRGQMKTALSWRGLALPKLAVTALRTQRQTQERWRKSAGKKWKDTGLVFTSRVGTALDDANVRRSFRHALKRVDGIEPNDWTPQELRHTFVSVMSALDVNIDQIAQLVGHSGSKVTESVYRHQLRPVIKFGAEAMDRVLNPEYSTLCNSPESEVHAQSVPSDETPPSPDGTTR